MREKNVAEDEPTKHKRQRRIVKKVETVREKAEKQTAAKPEKKRGVLWLTLSYIFWPIRFIGRVVKKIGRYVVPPYFKRSWEELKQVTWPNRRDSLKLTLAVIIFAIVFGIIITAVDFVLDKVFKEVLIN